LGIEDVRLPIDTHALLWWLSDDPSLSAAAREAMAATSNVLLVSAASAWEIATKVRLGRLPGAEELAADFQGFLNREGFTTMDISADHGIRAGLLPGPHKDPFDRMLISQAQAENIPIVTNERTFETYGVRRVW
jgi:PIN domain nuclease of toxin-antitoxin system